MSKRVSQIESTLQRAIAQVLHRDMADPRLEGALISITSVKVSADLHNATVNVSVLPAEAGRRAVAALRHASAHIATLTRKRVALRLVPHLSFRLDESLKKQATIYGAIHEALERTGPEPAPGSPPESAADDDDHQSHTAG